jgi:hypothetical protein
MDDSKGRDGSNRGSEKTDTGSSNPQQKTELGDSHKSGQFVSFDRPVPPEKKEG